MVTAARDLTAEQGWEHVRMVDVAKAVGVSRQTVYSEFSDRSGLAEALAFTEIQRFVEAVRTDLFTHGGDVFAASRAAILTVLTEAAESPLVRGIVTNGRVGADELLPYLTTRADVVLTVAGEVVTEWITRYRPEITPPAAASAADTIVRLTISHVVLPSAPPQATADVLAGVFQRLLQ